MSRRFVDITEELLHQTDKEVRSMSRFWSDEVIQLVERRKDQAKEILRNEPEKTVFDVAIISLLPVETVREVEKEVRG